MIGSVSGSSALGNRAMAAIGWLAGPLLGGGDPADMVATIEAEDAFDVSDRLDAVAAPTLVVGGTRDGFYSVDLFRQTADGVRDGRLELLDGKGHVASVAGSAAPRIIHDFVVTH